MFHFGLVKTACKQRKKIAVIVPIVKHIGIRKQNVHVRNVIENVAFDIIMRFARVRRAFALAGLALAVKFAEPYTDKREVVSQRQSAEVAVCFFERVAKPAIISVIAFFLFFRQVFHIGNNITEHGTSPPQNSIITHVFY